MQNLKKWVIDFWPQHFVVCFGLFGLGNVWNILGLEFFTYFAVVSFAITFGIVFLRAVFDINAFCDDCKDIGGLTSYLMCACCGFFLGGFVGGYHQFSGIMIWCISFMLGILCMALFTWMSFKDGLQWERILPIMFIFYCTPGIAGIVAPTLGLDLLGKITTVWSLIDFVIIFPLILIRIISKELPQNLMPTLMLFEAAPCMNMVAWIANFGPEPMLIPVGLVTIGQIALFCLVIQSPVLVSIPFNKNFGAFTFPLAIGAMAVCRLGEFYFSGQAQFGIFVLYWFEVLVATLVIACVVAAFAVIDVRRIKQLKNET